MIKTKELKIKEKTEAQEQIQVINYCNDKGYPYNLIFHIPNGGTRNVIEAVNLKRQGVKAGVPDLFLPYPKNGKHGLFIEMKSLRQGAKTSEDQDAWLSILENNGYRCEVCYGCNEAIAVLDDYLLSENEV